MTEEQATQTTAKYGRYMYFAMWIGLLALLSWYFHLWEQKAYNPNTSLQSAIDATGAYEITLQANRNGHYVSSGKINGINVTFLLDTGASDISIPAHIADKIGLKRGYKRQYQTANGIIENYTTRLQSVSIGKITRHNLVASINQNVNHDEILLGMSFLKTVELKQRDRVLTIRG